MRPLILASPRWRSRTSSRETLARIDALGLAFLISIAVHVTALLVGVVIIHEDSPHPQEFFSVHLIETPRQQPTPVEKIEAPPKQEKPKALPAPAKKSIVQPAPATPKAPAPTREEPAKAEETKLEPPERIEPPSFASRSPIEGGGSAAGAENLFGTGEVGIVPGSGSAGGGGTAAAGLGRGSGAPGLPAQSVLRTNRAAKPIQTARANYPPMALRAGLESDVTLKIEVDPQGKVTKVEIAKSGGSGFDEEALRAVKQSRFEPAQRDGEYVVAEFTYIYRFRLSR